MIRPRPSPTAVDPMLVAGVLGAAAVLRELRAIVAELAADGDRAPEAEAAAEPTELVEVVDVVVGLAALAGAVARGLPHERAAPAAPDDVAAVRPPASIPVEELLR